MKEKISGSGIDLAYDDKTGEIEGYVDIQLFHKKITPMDWKKIRAAMTVLGPASEFGDKINVKQIY